MNLHQDDTSPCEGNGDNVQRRPRGFPWPRGNRGERSPTQQGGDAGVTQGEGGGALWWW